MHNSIAPHRGTHAPGTYLVSRPASPHARAACAPRAHVGPVRARRLKTDGPAVAPLDESGRAALSPRQAG